MEIRVSRRELLRVLNIVNRIIPKKPVNPMMDYALVDKDDNGIWVSGMNEGGQLAVRLNCECIGDFGRVCLPAGQILPALGTIPEQMLAVTVQDGKITVSYQSGSFDVAGGKADEFPEPRTFGDTTLRGFVMRADTFVQSAKRALACSSEDMLRPQMSGVALDVCSGSVTFVSTDGNVLFTCKQMPESASGTDGITILPRMALPVAELMLAGKETVEVVDDGHCIRLRTDDAVLIVIGIEGKFPRYRSVFPAPTMTAEAVKSDLISLIKRVSVFSAASGLFVMEIEDGRISVKTEDLDFAKSAKSEMDIFSQAKICIGLNGARMLNLLSVVESEKVTLGFVDPAKAVVVKGECSESVIMPMMLR